MTMRIPLFPLKAVLFPGGTLALRIFEVRYTRMISDCLKNDTPFGVCLIRTGSEVGSAATPFRVGTLANIVDWEQRPDGLLGITARGGGRFRIVGHEADQHALLHAEIVLLDEPVPAPLADEFQPMRQLLQRITEELGTPLTTAEQHDDAGWVGCRLAELLPLPLRDKQRLLEVDDPVERLRRLRQMLQPDSVN